MAKRLFDLGLVIMVLPFLVIPLFLIWVLASCDMKSNGIFFQTRIGQCGKPFIIFKIKTMSAVTGKSTRIGSFLRKYKLDELPQLLNVLLGEMSFVGPRPDISGYYDSLQGETRKILELKPGITSEASIKYRNEEAILAEQENPLKYNDEIIFPDKVRINLEYYYNRSLSGDLKIIWKTIFE